MHLKKDLSKLVNFCTPILILKIGENKQHFQWIMLYYFKKGKYATGTHKNICAVCGGGTVTDRTCQKWFAKFHTGYFSLDIAPQLGRPVEINSNQMEILIENNQCYIPWETADILKISKSINVLVKMKNVSSILWKNLNEIFCNLVVLAGMNLR